MNGIKFVYFDIGYTLVDEDKVWETRCIEQAQTNEAKISGLTAEDIFHEIENSSKNYLPHYLTAVKKFGSIETVPYRTELERLYPDAVHVLECLSTKYKLGIIANQTDGLNKRLKEFGIINFFTEIISSWDYGIMKPDPELFKIGIEKSGYAPSEIVMIGDRLDNDIFPANSVGMKTIWLKQGFGGLQKPKTPEYSPDITVCSLAELLSIL